MMSTGLARGQVAGQGLIQVTDRLRRKLGEPAAEINQSVGRQHPGAAAVGQDREPVAARSLCHGERLHRIEQLLQPEHAQHTGAPEGGVVDRISAGQRSGVRSRGARALGMPTCLDHDHRLHTRCGPARRHELARAGNHLDVQQDRPGLGIAGEVVQHVAEVDIGHVAKRDQVREADAARRRPVDRGGHYRARLSNQGEVPRQRIDRRKAGVQADTRHHDAEAVGPDDAHELMLAGIEHRLAQDASRCLAFLEPGGDHDRGFGAAPGEIGDDAGHRLGGRADHGKIRDQGQARDIWIGEHALDGAVLRIDRHDRPVEAAAEQVAGHQRADRAGLLARADQGDRLGPEQELQIADRHRCSAPSGMRCLVQPASSTFIPWMAMPARIAF